MPEQTNQNPPPTPPTPATEPTKRPPKHLPNFGAPTKNPAIAVKYEEIGKLSFGVESIVGDSHTGILDTAESHFEAGLAKAREYAKKNKTEVTVRGTLYFQVPQKNGNGG